MKFRGVAGWFAAALFPIAAFLPPPEPQALDPELGPGQAMIWYLYHSGWAVKTKEHLLIFDYTEPEPPPARRSLETGSIDPAEIAAQDVIIFVSHVHTDHFDKRILGWRSTLKKVRYVWGWEKAGATEDARFGPERRTIAVDGLEISNISFGWDGFPESAFLVKVDGLTIFHAGDHGHSRGLALPAFKDNILYLAGLSPRLDLLFTPTFGGEIDSIRTLEPLAVFPMHDGGREREYEKFAKKAWRLGLNVEIGAADRPGARFFYSQGKLAAF